MTIKPLSKLLVVDDDVDILKVAKFALKRLENVEIKFLNSGEEAIKEALTFQPDLIILDVMMPKMDGVSTLQALRLLPTMAHTPIIFFTAKVRKDELSNYRHLGVIDVIIKPFDPILLPTAIQTIWRYYQENQSPDNGFNIFNGNKEES